MLENNKDIGIIRHGDVILVPVKSFEGVGGKRNSLVLAEGEATGHAHRVKGKARCFDGNESTPNHELIVKGDRIIVEIDSFLEVIEESLLTHEEHGDITLPEGEYAILIQREYDGLREMRVRD